MAGDVRVNDQVVTRPATWVQPADQLSVATPPPYVSRGGFKLAHALDHFGQSVAGLTILDVGASTGGFTDVVLQRGGRRVYAIDVGHGQLAWQLRSDPRVVVRERTNIRYLDSLPEAADAAVIDVSFISLSLVLPAVIRLLAPEGWIIALVKPQFEAGREQVGKGGVVRDPVVHRQVLERVAADAVALGLHLAGCVESPIRGPAGNREFLLYLPRTGPSLPAPDLIGACLTATGGSSEGEPCSST
jgi:23S rRNA (cytidine1920-2'-O)/16S rRNA (cytidine1409-2'-O)-methyltransferase